MKYLLLLLLTSCLSGQAARERLVVHKEACVKAGEGVIERSQTDGEPCWVIELRLDNLVHKDPDCLAYWGDAGVDLNCSPTGGHDGGS